MYQVAILKRPYANVETFEVIEDAEEHAINASIDDDAYGVWDSDSGALVSIAYQQELFSH